MTTEQTYLHGYSDEEQRRLVDQAEYFRELLIPVDLDWRAGDRVLEIGCAAGATLAVLAETFPGIRVAGIDLEERQIAFARAHLARSGVDDPDLRVGDVRALPWADGSFDRVFAMWILEHLSGAESALAEALRVLRSGGTIACTEVDYANFVVHPSTPAFEALARAQYDWFAAYGDPIAGRRLAPLLRGAGFVDVRSRIVGFHFHQDGTDELRRHVEYVAGFVAPAIEAMSERLGVERAVLERGLDDFRALVDRDDAAITHNCYRALGRKP